MVWTFALTLVGLVAGIVWLWRLTALPVWARLSALVPIGYASWCAAGMATHLGLAYAIPEDLPVSERARELAIHISCVMSFGVQFTIAALTSTFWMLFVASRYKGPPDAQISEGDARDG
jgi:hypothetical protein